MLIHQAQIMKSSKKPTTKKATSKKKFPDVTLSEGVTLDNVLEATFDPVIVEKVNEEMKKLKAQKKRKR